MLESLTAFVQPWADLYSTSAWLPTAVIAVHVLALFAGGGIAIGADRRVLLGASGSADEQLAIAHELHRTHGIVIGAIVVMVLSGTALATADVGTFASSSVFWIKMAMFVVLIGNGALMRRAEAGLLAAARSPQPTVPADADRVGLWPRLRLHAGISLACWFVVVLLGVIVANV